MKIKIIVTIIAIFFLMSSCAPAETDVVSDAPTQTAPPTATQQPTPEPTLVPTPEPTPTATPEMIHVMFGYVTMTYDTSILILRAEADKTSEKAGKLTNGTQVEILEVLDEWYKVQVNDLTGYLYKDYVGGVVSTSVPVGTKIEDIQTAAPEEGVEAWVNVDLLNIRSQPSSGSPIVGRIPFAESVKGVVEGEWMHVEYRGINGYIFAGTLDSGRQSIVYNNGDLEPLED